jgi:hypothetical protein
VFKTDHEELAKQFGTQLRGIYRSVLSKEPFSFDMGKIFKDKDKRESGEGQVRSEHVDCRSMD